MNADDKLSDLNRRLWIWLPLSGAILLLLSSLMQNREQAESLAFDRLSQAFAQSVNLIHARWVQLNKPNSIQWPVNNSNKTILVTNNGWPIVKNTAASLTENCEQIWLNILETPLDIDGESIFSSVLFKNGHWLGCNYRFSELSFSYWHTTGRVEKN